MDSEAISSSRMEMTARPWRERPKVKLKKISSAAMMKA